MIRGSRLAAFAVLSLAWGATSASAETMRCQSVNGNLNCSGSAGVACQTVNGRRVCVSGHGDVVQSFGGGGSSDRSGPDIDKDFDKDFDKDAANDPAGDAAGLDGAPDVPALKQRWERGRRLLLQRDGDKLHLRTDRLSVDRD